MGGYTFQPEIDFRRWYDRFNTPVTAFDCGKKCAPYNPRGVPFCCDICHAVPAIYREEWEYLQPNTDLWYPWLGDECPKELESPEELKAETPDNMLLMACLGAPRCQRAFRSISCRQFPFFPYITHDLRFIGLAYEWEFEPVCWVISHLDQVTITYRAEFIALYDELFEQWPGEQDGYAVQSERMREVFSGRRRRIPILHRNGGFYLLSPDCDRMRRADPQKGRRFGHYV